MTKCCSIFKRGIIEATADKPTRVGCVNCRDEATAEPLIDYATRIPTKDVSARSSNIAAVGYDAGPRLLAVHFKNGTRYVFVDVPEHTAVALTSAHEGFGTIFAATIRGKFRSMKLEPPAPTPEAGNG